MKRITFGHRSQYYRSFDVDENGVIIGCEPPMGVCDSLIGMRGVVDRLPDGERYFIINTNRDGSPRSRELTIPYPVVSVRTRKAS